MNILEFKANYKPEVAAGIELDANTAEDLASYGHCVYLFVPKPSRGITKEISRATPKQESLVNGKLKIYRYGMYAEGKSFKQRLTRYCFCSAKQLWHGLRQKNVDLIFAGSTPPFQGVICSWIKKVKKVPFVFNCQDIFPESMIASGLTAKGSKICRIGDVISDITYKAADEIIVISESMRDTLISKGVPEKKIHVVYNWVDENVIRPIAKEDNKLINELNIPEYDFTVVYAGNLGYAQGIDVILEAAELLADDTRIGFILFGNGSIENMVKEKIVEKGLKNVKLYPLQPYERVSEVYSIGDACIVSCKPGTGGFAMPSKTWSIMGCGRAVLASFDSNSMLQKIIEENNCGLFSEAGDANKLVENIVYLCNTPESAIKKGNNSRTYIECHLSRRSCTKMICNIIEKAVDN